MSTVKTYITTANDSASWLDRATIIGFDIAYAAYGEYHLLTMYSSIDNELGYGSYAGIHVALFILCFNCLWEAKKTRPRYAYAWMTYITLLFLLGSLANAIDMRMSQMIFVDNRDFPGGPGAYAVTTYTVPINILCTAACVIGGWLQDALLVRGCLSRLSNVE